jgi:hypothetical protein
MPTILIHATLELNIGSVADLEDIAQCVWGAMRGHGVFS